MKTKTLLILIAGTALLLAAAYAITRPRSTTTNAASETKPPVFPTLTARANDITEIVFTRPEMTFTLRKDPGDSGLWRVVEKANHPARGDAIRTFIIALSQLREVERKTSRPELYSKLGVEDPIAPKAVTPDTPLPQSTLVTLKDAKGESIAAAVLGNPKWGAAPGLYLRRVGDPTVLLAEGRVDVQRDPIKWTEDQFANIAAARIKSITISPPPILSHESPVHPSLTIARRAQSDKLALQSILAGQELKDPAFPDSLGTTLTTLPFQDVAPLNTIDFVRSDTSTPGNSAEFRTFDGLIVNIQTVQRDGRTWWKLVASVDESIPAQVPPPPDQQALAAPAATTLEALKKEAADLNTRWSLYAYAPVDWKAQPLSSALSDLLREAPASQTPAMSPTPAAHSPLAEPGKP